jgi:hypothetical protein
MYRGVTRCSTTGADLGPSNAIVPIEKNERDQCQGCLASSQRRLEMQGLAACRYHPCHRWWRGRESGCTSRARRGFWGLWLFSRHRDLSKDIVDSWLPVAASGCTKTAQNPRRDSQIKRLVSIGGYAQIMQIMRTVYEIEGMF